MNCVEQQALDYEITPSLKHGVVHMILIFSRFKICVRKAEAVADCHSSRDSESAPKHEQPFNEVMVAQLFSNVNALVRTALTGLQQTDPACEQFIGVGSIPN